MSLKQGINHRLRIVEPVYDVANQRAEYRLPADMMFFSDFRLINVGSSVANATLYNAVLGAEAHIRAIRLFDGATELDAVNDFPQWRSFQKLQVSNDGAADVGSVLSRNRLGFIAQGRDDILEATFADTPELSSSAAASLANFGRVGQKAWISLKSIFPILQAVPVMPTGVFRQLRVEIEYNSAAAMTKLIVDDQVANLSSSRALLLADEIQDPEQEKTMMKAFASAPIRYRGLVQDQFFLQNVAAPAAGAVVHTQTQRLRGFDSSYVHSLIVKVVPRVMRQPVANTNNPFGQLGSQVLYSPEVQVAVNGQNLIPREGLRGKMRALAMTTDSVGSLDLPIQVAKLGQKFNDKGLDGIVEQGRGLYLPYAIDVEQFVEDMQLTITRTAISDNAELVASYDVLCFAHVDRAIVFEKGAGMTGGDSRYRIVNIGA